MRITYPWYDSNWLSDYMNAKALIKHLYPEKHTDFIETIAPLRTSSDFQVSSISNIFSDETLQEARSVIKSIEFSDWEKHEFDRFGRLIKHNHPFFVELQASLTELVSEAVGEEVIPQYNFLCLYTYYGSCQVHMDSPESKFTLDCCIEQSEPWPIYFSDIQPWPENCQWNNNPNWENNIFNNPDIKFSEYTLQENDGIIFSGSSQWHYRDAIPKKADENFCHLIFFHFIPADMKAIVDPRNWPEIFNIPELKKIRLSSI